jgi:hypothetical protein
MSQSPFLFDETLVANCVLDNGARTNRLEGCDALFRDYSKHYDREISDERYQRFLKYIYLIHEHNSKNDTNHRITLNQFSSLHEYELPLAAQQSIQMEDQFDLESNFNFRKLHSLKSILECAHFDYFDKPITYDHNVSFNYNGSKENSTYQSTNTDKDKEQAWRSDNDIDDPTEHFDNFNRSLNWATKENPDGVSIVHRASDQVGIFRILFCRHLSFR